MPTIDSSREILTLREAAEFLRISERKCWELSRNGELPCYRIGSQDRYLRSLLEQVVREGSLSA